MCPSSLVRCKRCGNVYIHTGFQTLYHYSATYVPRPPVGGGVPDAPYVALRDGCGWLLKRASTDVGEGVLTLPLAVRREILVRMGGLYSPRFRKPRPKGGRGRPPLQLDWDGFEIYAAERIRIVTHDMMRGGNRYTHVSHRPTEGASGTPPPTGGCVSDVSATIHRRRKRQPAGRRGRRPLRGGF